MKGNVLLIIYLAIVSFINLLSGNYPAAIIMFIITFGDIILFKLYDIEKMLEKNENEAKEKNEEYENENINTKKRKVKSCVKEYSNKCSNVENKLVDTIINNVLLLELKYNIKLENYGIRKMNIVKDIIDKVIETNDNLKTSNDIINEVNVLIEDIFKNAKANNIKFLSEDYIKNKIFSENKNSEYYYESTIKKEKNLNVYDW